MGLTIRYPHQPLEMMRTTLLWHDVPADQILTSVLFRINVIYPYCQRHSVRFDCSNRYLHLGSGSCRRLCSHEPSLPIFRCRPRYIRDNSSGWFGIRPHHLSSIRVEAVMVALCSINPHKWHPRPNASPVMATLCSIHRRKPCLRHKSIKDLGEMGILCLTHRRKPYLHPKLTRDLEASDKSPCR